MVDKVPNRPRTTSGISNTSGLRLSSEQENGLRQLAALAQYGVSPDIIGPRALAIMFPDPTDQLQQRLLQQQVESGTVDSLQKALARLQALESIGLTTGDKDYDQAVQDVRAAYTLSRDVPTANGTINTSATASPIVSDYTTKALPRASGLGGWLADLMGFGGTLAGGSSAIPSNNQLQTKAELENYSFNTKGFSGPRITPFTDITGGDAATNALIEQYIADNPNSAYTQYIKSLRSGR